MRFYPVELVFVAVSVVDEGFVEPFASLNSGVSAYGMVFLFAQSLYELGRDVFFHEIHDFERFLFGKNKAGDNKHVSKG